jgi:hypothetical protein
MIVQTAIPKRKAFPAANYHARTFLMQGNAGKAVARDRLTQIIQEVVVKHYPYEKRIHYFSLPGIWWHFEKNLERRAGQYGNRTRMSFTAVESSAETYSAAAMNMPVGPNGFRVLCGGRVVTNFNGYTLIHATTSEYLTRCRKPFRVAWLDYFGPISRRMLNDLELLAALVPKEGPAVVAVNVTVGRETPAITKLINGRNRSEFLDHAFTSLFPGFRRLQKESYKEEGKTASRLQIAYGRGNF